MSHEKQQGDGEGGDTRTVADFLLERLQEWGVRRTARW
jgi:hypothetical protein